MVGQDQTAWIIQGPITDRTTERLGVTDVGLIMFRKMIEEQIKIVEDGGDPMGTVRDERVNEVIELPLERWQALFRMIDATNFGRAFVFVQQERLVRNRARGSDGAGMFGRGERAQQIQPLLLVGLGGAVAELLAAFVEQAEVTYLRAQPRQPLLKSRVGDLFDGEGFVRGLRRKGLDLHGTDALVVGTGGVERRDEPGDVGHDRLGGHLDHAGRGAEDLGDARFEGAETLVRSLITLPTHSRLSSSDIVRVAALVGDNSAPELMFRSDIR